LRGEPHVVADRSPVDALQHQLEGERQLQLADDDDRRLALDEADKVAAADLALDAISEAFEVSLDGKIQRGFQCGFSPPNRRRADDRRAFGFGWSGRARP
jgi:hypothetical protein